MATFVDIVNATECDILSKITFTQFKMLCEKVNIINDVINSEEITTVNIS